MRLTTLFELTLRVGFAESLLGESSFMMASPFVPKNPPPAPIPCFDRTEIFFLSFKNDSQPARPVFFSLSFLLNVDRRRRTDVCAANHLRRIPFLSVLNMLCLLFDLLIVCW